MKLQAIRRILLAVAMLWLADAAYAQTYNQVGAKESWPLDTDWLAISSSDEPADAGVLGRLDFIGSSASPGAYWNADADYFYVRVRVNVSSVTNTTYSDTLIVLLDVEGYGNTSKPDFGFAWDTNGGGVTDHGLEMMVPSTLGPTWGVTRMADLDGSSGQKLSNDINGGGRTTDGYVRTVSGQAGGTTFVDFAVSWSYLNAYTDLRKSQSWRLAFGSIQNANDHAALNADVAGGANLGDNISLGWSAATPTAVRGVEVRAERGEAGNLVRWRTAFEVRNLGFNVYRDGPQGRERLNPSLIGGSALLAGPHTALTAGNSYSWLDAGGPADATYWVESVDLNGEREWHGPAVPEPEAGGGAKGSGAQATLLSSMGQAVTFGEATGPALQPAELRATAAVATAKTLQKQFALAARSGVKIGITSEGWHSVSQPDLVAAGFDPNASAATLQLFVDGIEQPIAVSGQVKDKLGPQGSIRFYAMGLDSTWSDTRVYWLTWGMAQGGRIQTGKSLAKGAKAPASFPFTVEWRPRTLYFAALMNGDEDNFFGPVIAGGGPVNQALTISSFYPAAAGVSTLNVTLQGATSGPHNVSVQVNGYPVGAVTLNNQENVTAALPVSNSYLVEGPNTLTFTAQGGPDDVSVVDTVQLTYPHSYTADGDTLKFTVSAGSQVTVGGFSSSAITLIDVTDPAAPVIVSGGKTAAKNGLYALTIVPGGSGPRTLLALTGGQAKWPTSLTANHPSSWSGAQRGYDTVLITHADFEPSLEPLKNLRQSQGRKVAVVDVEDLYDEFNFGAKSPYALKSFLSRANSTWTVPPHFVLLVGDATFDPQDNLGAGDFDFVPTYLVGTQFLETASDDWFADLTGSGVPQMALGRLPVRTLEEAGALVNRIVAYEQSGTAGWKQQALLVAGQNDADNNFEAGTAAVKALLPPSVAVAEIHGGDASAHGDLLAWINAGTGLVNYDGHGSVEIWANGVLDGEDARALTNGTMTPVVVSMTCLNGFFQDPSQESLAEALLSAPGGGAVAVWASSGLTDSTPQAAMNQALIRALYGAQPMTLGDAAAAAKAAVGSVDVRRTWILFGDPATRLK